ncbi:glutathione S-transferase family protein [Malonomonas rubra]|uniref:glutathione S-transferase family protein n=1 Tax=Malonomonas rubra TaxID=57040 RepID=UPI0026EBFC10|nr:glutathione S-transferase family protein [Malonomonas rubra]
MYDLYGMPMTRATRVVWALEEIGAEYRYHLVNLMKGEGQAPDFLRLNPFGKVPVLVDGDLVLSESAAICTYLGDQYPETELVPPVGTAERARYDQWCYFVLTELEQPLWTIHKHRFVFPEEKKVSQILPVAAWEFQRALAVLDKGLGEQEYLVNNSFTMADILAAHTLRWARAAKQAIESQALQKYEKRVCGRTALERAKQREQAAKQ